MNIVSKIRRIKERPERLIIGIQLRVAHLFNNQPLLIKALYRLAMGKKLDLKNPRTFSEKIQWLKLHDHNELYHTLVDKYAVKQYVSERIGKEYVIPSFGVWDSFDAIDFNKLPEQFVLKTTNGGGGSGVVICRDKSTFSKEPARALLEQSMKNDIYLHSGEWAYKGVKPRILAEQLLEVRPDGVGDLPDYKWYCFNGEPKYCQVIQDRSSVETIDFFDTMWNHLEFVGLNPDAIPAIIQPAKPANLDAQIRIARQLSQDLPFSRIDLYEIGNNIYFGEIAFYPASGFGEFRPNQYNEMLGEMVKLPGEIRGRVIIRKLQDGSIRVSKPDLPDYKFFCFNGKVKALFVATDRFDEKGSQKNVKFDFFDESFNHLPFRQGHPNSDVLPVLPRHFDKMKYLAEQLAVGIPHVRVDLYESGDRIYFGEMTFYHFGGFMPFNPDLWDLEFGQWIDLGLVKEKI